MRKYNMSTRQLMELYKDKVMDAIKGLDSNGTVMRKSLIMRQLKPYVFLITQPGLVKFVGLAFDRIGAQR